MKNRFVKLTTILTVAILIALLMSISVVAATSESSHETTTFYIEDCLAQAGESVTVKVYVENNPGILNALLTLSFDERLVLSSIEQGTALSSLDFTPPGRKNTPCNFLWDAIEEVDSSNGVILLLTFEIPADADPGTVYSLDLSYAYGDIADGDLNSVECKIINGTIEVLDYTPGDVNGDGRFNGTDVTLLRRHITGGYDVSIHLNAADVNNDGRINGTDVTLIRRYIAGGYGVEPKPSTHCFSHSLKKVEAVEPTCSKEGNNEYWQCENCKKLYSDANSNDEISHEDVIIAPANHDYSSIVIAPTCTEQGYTIYICANCGDTYNDTFVDKLGHDMGEWYEYSAPTCTDTGAEHSDCSRCEYYESKVISATGHKYDTVWDMDADGHWHTVLCGHTEEASDKAAHVLNSNGVCVFCKYESRIQLDTPTIEKIEYDKVYWSHVENASKYSVTINSSHGDYSVIVEADEDNNSVVLSNLKNASGQSITVAGYVNVKVQALGEGRYTPSDKSESKSHYYVPEKQNLDSEESNLYHYGMGKGYNFVENGSINTEYMSQISVININKLLTLGKLYHPTITDGLTDYYSFSSIEELELHLNAKGKIGSGVSVGKLSFKKELSLDVGVDYSTYAYNNTYILQEDFIYGVYEFSDYEDPDLEHCLTEAFLNDIGIAKDMERVKENSGLEYLYSKYGTHVILGVARGASYTATYTISTNKENIAAKVKLATQSSATVPFKQIVQLNFDMEGSLDASGNWKSNETETHYRVEWIGSTKGGLPSPDKLEEAIKHFENGMTEENAAVIRLSERGAISIGTLIGYIDDTFGARFEEYVNSKADEEYQALYSKYTKPSTLDVSVNNENGENVLKIDLSDYQYGGSLSNTYNVNLVDGIFTVYPKMMGKDFDRILITGVFNEQNEKLIDNFSIKLAKGWNKDIVIEVKNIGVISGYEKGIVDLSDVSNAWDVSVEYSGVNIIKPIIEKATETNPAVYGDLHFYASRDGKPYHFTLKVSEDELKVFTTINASDALSLPVPTKDGYDFVAWVDGNDKPVTDYKGKVLDTYVASNATVALYPKYEPTSYKITLNHEDDPSYSGNGYFYVKVNKGAYEDFEGTINLENKQIPIPSREGYVFCGYYVSVNNNSTANAVGSHMYVNADGFVTSEAISTQIGENIDVYAMWIPATYSVTLDNMGADDVGTTVYYTQYKTGVYSDKDCSNPIETISVPKWQGYTFAGYYDDNNNQIIDAKGNINMSVSIEYKSSQTLHAIWTTDVYTITLDGDGATYTPTVQTLYLKYGVGFYTTPDCTGDPITRITPHGKTGHNIDGYYLNGKQYIDNQGNILVDSSEITSDITLTAKWTQVVFKVTFNYHGGSKIADVPYGQSAEAPVIDDILFAGWDKDFSNVMQNMTVNAQYFTGTNKVLQIDTNSYLSTPNPTITIMPQTNKILLSASPSNITCTYGAYGPTSGGMPTIQNTTIPAIAKIIVMQNGDILASAYSFDMQEIVVLPNQEVVIKIEPFASIPSDALSCFYSGNILYTLMSDVTTDRPNTDGALSTKTGSVVAESGTTISFTPSSERVVLNAYTLDLGCIDYIYEFMGGMYMPKQHVFESTSASATYNVKQNGKTIYVGSTLNYVELYVTQGEPISITLSVTYIFSNDYPHLTDSFKWDGDCILESRTVLGTLNYMILH